MTPRLTEAEANATAHAAPAAAHAATSGVPRPPVGAPPQWTFPSAARGRLGNGLEVVSYDVPGQYVVSVRLAVPMPLVREPRGREGIGTIMARTLDEGTARHTAEEFAELLERKGIALGAGASESGLSVDMDVAKGHLSAALALMSEAVREPAFPENEVSRHVKTRLAEIDHERAVPGQRAALAFLETYFDEAERASRPSAGTRASVEAITREAAGGLPRRPGGAVGQHHRGGRRPDRRGRARRGRAGLRELGRYAVDGRRAGGAAPGRRRRPGRVRGPSRLGADRDLPRLPRPRPTGRRRLGALPGAGLRAGRLAPRAHRRRAA